MSDCPRFGKYFVGCNFEARYESEFPKDLEVNRASVLALEALRTKTYVRDVCTRCGKTVERPK